MLQSITKLELELELDLTQLETQWREYETAGTFGRGNFSGLSNINGVVNYDNIDTAILSIEMRLNEMEIMIGRLITAVRNSKSCEREMIDIIVNELGD